MVYIWNSYDDSTNLKREDSSIETLYMVNKPAIPSEHQLLINLFDAMPFSVYVVDIKTYELIFVNQAYKQCWQENPSAKCYELIYQEDAPCAHCNITHLCAQHSENNAGGDTQRLIHELFNPVDDHWYQIQDQLITWPDGRLVKYSIAVDISDLKDVQHQLTEIHAEIMLKTRALRDAALTDILKTDFLTALSHELRTPLNAISGSLDLIQSVDMSGNDYVQSQLQTIENGNLRITELVDDVLHFSEIQAGKMQLNPVRCDLLKIFSSLQQVYSQLCQSKGLNFSWQQNLDGSLQDSLATMVLIDADKLKTIIAKLLDNAVKFTDAGGVSCEISITELNQLEICICDSGCGINAHETPVIFKPFRQKDSGFQRCYEGLGVGLFLCQQWVNALKGRLWLDDVSTGGTAFHLLLPLEPCPYQQDEPLQSQASAVLIVEDNPVNQRVMQHLLNALKLSFFSANNGQEALDVLQHESIGLVLMDLQMPVMDGFRCTRKIRCSADEYQSLPIIAVTANVLSADRQRCIDVGMNDFLAKPIRLDTLKQMLSKYLHLQDA